MSGYIAHGSKFFLDSIQSGAGFSRGLKSLVLRGAFKRRHTGI
jgi:hypothetical protein